MLPAPPIRTASTAAGASVSKALWAGIYANSGSAAKFANVAQGMGLSQPAVQGVAARSVGVKIARTAATSASPFFKRARPAMASKRAAVPNYNGQKLRNFAEKIQHVVTDKTTEASAKPDHVAVTTGPEKNKSRSLAKEEWRRDRDSNPG